MNIGKAGKGILFFLSIIVFSGCAVGNRHNYSGTEFTVEMATDQAAAVGVYDQRHYIVNGEKGPNFVGTSRGGFGNPFNVGTVSGKSLAAEMSSAIKRSLEKGGYRVTEVPLSHRDDLVAVKAKFKAKGIPRSFLVTVKEWKSDTYTNTALHFDVTLEVLDGNGDVLASERVSGKDDLGGSFMNPPAHAKKAAPEAFEKKMMELFSSPAIQKTLQ